MIPKATMYTLEAKSIASYELITTQLRVPTDAPIWLVLEHISSGSNKPELELYEHEEGKSLAHRCKLSPEMLPGLKDILDNFPFIKSNAAST